MYIYRKLVFAAPPSKCCRPSWAATGISGLVAMTPAWRAEGRQFDPGWVYLCRAAATREHYNNSGQFRRRGSDRPASIAPGAYFRNARERLLNKKQLIFYARAAAWLRYLGAHSALVMTSASHAEGCQFDPGQLYAT